MGAKSINLRDLLRRNPNVDPGTLAQNLQRLRELEQIGLDVGPNYDLDSPYTKDPDSNYQDANDLEVNFSGKSS